MSRVLEARIIFLADDYAGYESRNLLGQHGLSALIETINDNGSMNKVLFDTGQYADGIIHNARILGIDLKDIDAIALSHNHYDHTGGLLGILKHIGKRIPVIAHPDIFRPSLYIAEDNIRLDIGVPNTRRTLEDMGAYFLLTKNPMEIAPGIYFLGEVKREYPELAPLLTSNYTIVDGMLVKHELRDDTGIAIVVDGLGAIVIGGCSHSGIVNIVHTAEKVTGEKTHAVMGGFHLLGFDKSRVSKIINLFREQGVEEVHTGHCTGIIAEYMFMEEFRGKFTRIHSGYKVVFKAR